MNKRKTLKELTLKDNFMFCAVMSDEENCRRLLEMILQFPIEKVEVSKEKSIIYHPEYRGIRLDVYAKDENNTHYNVEMQSVRKDALGKRTRYYHSQIDMEVLSSGADYSELPNVYVIFICDFDPYGKKRYCYTFERRCTEDGTVLMADGCQSIFLSTKGENPEEVPEEMVKFLDYVAADLAESTGDFKDEFVKSLQDSVRQVKVSREMEEHFMTLQEVIWDERKEARKEGRAEGLVEGLARGKAEDVLELLEDLGSIPAELHTKVMGETDLTTLKRWHKLAAKSETLESFLQNM